MATSQTTPKTPFRQLKRQVLRLLTAPDQTEVLSTLCRLPARQVVNPLFSLLFHAEALVRWRSVVAMGAVVDGLARRDIESARVVMRRFVWNLNDESGGIGWGSPECMGEIMARNRCLAEEYACLLVSYVRLDMNHLEHPVLQRGVLWAVARLGTVRPALLRDAVGHLRLYMMSDDPYLRGLAAWAARAIGDITVAGRLAELSADHRKIEIFRDGEMLTVTVAGLVAA